MNTCQTCQLWEPIEGASDGICGYNPPPALRAIYDLAHSEPSTHIDWRRRLAEPFTTQPGFTCSEHRPKLST